jgi:tight adherence protein C
MEMTLGAAAAVFLTVVCFALSLRRAPIDPARSRVASLAGSRSLQEGQPTVSFGDRVLQPFFGGLGNRIASVLPAGILASLKLKLIRAGEPITVGGYVMLCVIASALLASLGLLLAIAANGTLDAKTIGMAVVAGGIGLVLPQVWLSSRVRQRKSEIIKSLPDSFDLITTCVEAGLGLDAALTRVAEKVKGSFSGDLSITLREIGMGRNRAEALRDLANNTGVDDLNIFVNAIIQAEQMGTSIGQVLRVQSDQMRTRRRQRAEETANKAPVKMIFPLVLCILPTLFIVIMGPAAIQLFESFSKN